MGFELQGGHLCGTFGEGHLSCTADLYTNDFPFRQLESDNNAQNHRWIVSSSYFQNICFRICQNTFNKANNCKCWNATSFGRKYETSDYDDMSWSMNAHICYMNLQWGNFSVNDGWIYCCANLNTILVNVENSKWYCTFSLGAKTVAYFHQLTIRANDSTDVHGKPYWLKRY